MGRRAHYARYDRGGAQRLLRAGAASATVQQASIAKASVGAVAALEEAVGGDLSALAETITEVGVLAAELETTAADLATRVAAIESELEAEV